MATSPNINLGRFYENFTIQILPEKSQEAKYKREKILDGEVKKIAKAPDIGVEKRGDLRGVLVHKFKIHSTLYLLAYRLQNENLELVMLGPHENYYRDLKSHPKSQ